MRLDDGPEGVLEEFEEHMTEMAGDVHERQRRVADELDLGRVEETIMVLADEPGVLHRLLGELAYVGAGADDADVVGLMPMSLISQRDVLADQHPDADT